VYYIYKKTYIKYCKITIVREIINLLKELNISNIQNNNKIVCLNIKRKAKYLKDKATTLDLIFRSLSKDDQALFDNYNYIYNF
jgi:hypothetical protein